MVRTLRRGGSIPETPGNPWLQGSPGGHRASRRSQEQKRATDEVYHAFLERVRYAYTRVPADGRCCPALGRWTRAEGRVRRWREAGRAPLSEPHTLQVILVHSSCFPPRAEAVEIPVRCRGG